MIIMGQRPKPLCRLAAVVLQQPSQPLLAADLPERIDRLIGLVLSNSLVAPLLLFRKQFVL
jgi:hypothetical protein